MHTLRLEQLRMKEGCYFHKILPSTGDKDDLGIVPLPGARAHHSKQKKRLSCQVHFQQKQKNN